MRLASEHRWTAAYASFAALAADFPQDGPSRTMSARLSALQDAPPPPEWDGVWEDLSQQVASQLPSGRSSAFLR
jgi:hypothetical protein